MRIIDRLPECFDRFPERSDEEYTPRGRKDGFTYEREDSRCDYDYNRRAHG